MLGVRRDRRFAVETALVCGLFVDVCNGISLSIWFVSTRFANGYANKAKSIGPVNHALHDTRAETEPGTGLAVDGLHSHLRFFAATPDRNS
jgi:hypothetical protein